MLLRINQDVRTTTIVVWKDGAYPILENAMLQKKKKKKSLKICPYLISKISVRTFLPLSFASHGKYDTKHRYLTRFLKNR